MRTLKMLAVGALLLFASGGALGYIYLTSHGLSAREKPMRIEAWIAGKLRRLAIPASAASLKNPLESSPLSIAEGRDHFADHCATCHGNRGDGKTMINEGLYPPAPDMRADDTQRLTDGELLYIIKNGIRFTGMPGWGGGEDEENWKLVGFIRHLPKLSDKEIQLMNEVNQLEVGHESR